MQQRSHFREIISTQPSFLVLLIETKVQCQGGKDARKSHQVCQERGGELEKNLQRYRARRVALSKTLKKFDCRLEIGEELTKKKC